MFGQKYKPHYMYNKIFQFHFRKFHEIFVLIIIIHILQNQPSYIYLYIIYMLCYVMSYYIPHCNIRNMRYICLGKYLVIY